MTDFFSPDYFTARTRFCSGVLANGGQIESIVLDAKGPRGEDLSIDIGWFGSPEPKRAFVHSSGLHGVEGFAGSAVQLQWLEVGQAISSPADCAVVIVHVMNPFGMAWLRRVNENNVDLTHNFLGADEKYEGAPKRDPFLLRAAYRMLRQRDLEGQYEFPEGLAYGGKRHEQTTRRFQLYISGKLANAERIVAIDVHTGPGGDALSKGSLEGLYRRMFPGTDVRFTQQQFATVNGLRTLAAIRSGNNLFEVFCPRSTRWRNRVLESGKQVIEEGLSEAFEPLSAANGVPAN